MTAVSKTQMTIGELATLAHVRTKTIRYYEEIGLLPQPGRAANGYRVYSDDALSRLSFIRHTQALGLSLSAVKDILTLHDIGDRPCQHVAAFADEKIAEIDRQIANLYALRAGMVELVTRANEVTDDLDTSCSICPAITSTRS